MPNHVVGTQAMITSLVRARYESLLRDQGRPAVVWPDIPEDLLVFLEDLYPPRCLETLEKVEDHLRYAGVVDLLADMRHHFKLSKEIEAEVEGGVEIPMGGSNG